MQDMWASMRERASSLVGNITTELERQRHINEIEKENARLRQEIEAATTDLGRMVLKQQREGRLSPEALDQTCRAIEAMEAQLGAQEEMVEQIRTSPLAAAPACIHCGAPLEDDAAFCTECGASQVAAPEAAQTCATCGAFLEANAVFCGNCGAPVAAEPEPASPPQPVPAQDIHCTVCGARLMDDAVFCGNCGAPVAELPGPEEAVVEEEPVEVPEAGLPGIEAPVDELEEGAVAPELVEEVPVEVPEAERPEIEEAVETDAEALTEAEVVEEVPVEVPGARLPEEEAAVVALEEVAVAPEIVDEAPVEVPEAGLPEAAMPEAEPAETAAEPAMDEAVPQTAPADEARCLQCDTVLPPGEQFCPGCGWVVDWNAVRVAAALSPTEGDGEEVAFAAPPPVAGEPAASAREESAPVAGVETAAEEPARARTCPSCQQQLRPQARFCPSCGQDVSTVTAPPPPVARRHCGVILEPEMLFCPECGAEVSDADAVDAHCPGCGSILRPGTSSCPVCGYSVSDLR